MGNIDLPNGLTVLVNPSPASVDVVFVHGFTGSPDKTWTHKAKSRTDDNSEPPKKFIKTGRSSETVYWPEDLLKKTLPDARILTYGYDTKIHHVLSDPPPNNATVYDIASDFLVVLEARRRTNPLRPILFIAHSLGGIIVKELLRQSNRNQAAHPGLHAIFTATVGVIFFGTPHAGADPRSLEHHLALAIVKWLGCRLNNNVINALLPSSERLRELREEFPELAQQQGWKIHSFQERHGCLEFRGKKVVEDTSSSLCNRFIETTEHIERDHRGMCRFTGLDDPEYAKVASAVTRILKDIPKKPTVSESYLTEGQREELRESLKFDQIDARLTTIKTAHRKTCGWLLNTPEYRDWLDPSKLQEHHGFFWMKGKPGTGKSTMMKYMLTQARRKKRDKVLTLDFFFNARGDLLEQSTLGMYRSLLFQLLTHVPEFPNIFDAMGLKTSQYEWTTEILEEAFEKAICNLGSYEITCYIDALDECEEAQIRDMVSQFEGLGERATKEHISFRVFFSSRHYPHITVSSAVDLVLQNQAGHSVDISAYLDSKLKIGQGKAAQDIRMKVLEKASGVFMWVVLVVQMLNKECDFGRRRNLGKKLQDIPADLHKLFRNILKRDADNTEQLLVCIQWVLFAKRPLEPRELYLAILSGSASQPIEPWDPEEISNEDLELFILAHSKGLIELTKSKTQKVQFIHESVRDFLLKENGLSDVWPNLAHNFEGQSHDRLKRCCLAHLEAGIVARVAADVPTQGLPQDVQESKDLTESVRSKFAFLEYAIQNIIHHAEAAAEHGIPQHEFVRNFPIGHWIYLRNILEQFAVRRYNVDSSLLYIFAEYNARRLLEIQHNMYPDRDMIFGVGPERYGTPLLAALVAGSNDVVSAILKVEVERHPDTSDIHRTLARCLRGLDARPKYQAGFQFTGGRGGVFRYVLQNMDYGLANFLLSTKEDIPDITLRSDVAEKLVAEAVSAGHQDIVKAILSTKKVKVELKNGMGETLLRLEARNGDESTMELLFAEGADLDITKGKGREALHEAARQGHKNIVELLLKHRVNAEPNDQDLANPLRLAASHGHINVVELLLEHGADTESKNQFSITPLHEAARSGHENIVKLLLEHRVDAEAKSSAEMTPLHSAAEEGYQKIVELLLAHGVDSEPRNSHQETPLHLAAAYGHEKTVKLLISTQKVDLESKDEYGQAPLHRAVLGNHMNIVKLLVTEGGDLNLRDIYRQTPLHCAAFCGHGNIVEFLLSTERVDLALGDEIGDTPLHTTAYYHHGNIVKMLLLTGKADPESKNNSGETPLDLAKEKGWQDIVALLQEWKLTANTETAYGSRELPLITQSNPRRA